MKFKVGSLMLVIGTLINCAISMANGSDGAVSSSLTKAQLEKICSNYRTIKTGRILRPQWIDLRQMCVESGQKAIDEGQSISGQVRAACRTPLSILTQGWSHSVNPSASPWPFDCYMAADDLVSDPKVHSIARACNAVTKGLIETAPFEALNAGVICFDKLLESANLGDL